MQRGIQRSETGRPIVPTSLMRDYGVHIDTDGKANFASQEHVSVWQYVVAIMGLPWALARFFNRSEFPKIVDKNKK